MKIILGLGNPGKKFKNTRHNLGFLILEKFAKEKNFPKFEVKKGVLSLISQKRIKKEKIILAKPQTFMNESGKAAKLILKHFKTKTKDLVVVHDDLALPLGKMKISFGRGAGGHKGVQSIIREIKTKNFLRLRVGIKTEELKNKKIKDFVLENFKKEERKILKDIIKEVIEAIEILIKEGKEKAMSIVNK